MTQHTPAPWYVDEDPRDGMEWNRHICDSGDNRICFMAHSNGRAPERDEANARLIAAAPDTHEALKATAASLAAAISLLERAGKTAKKAAPSDTMFDMMISDYRKALDEARAAIAKATGGDT